MKTHKGHKGRIIGNVADIAPSIAPAIGTRVEIHPASDLWMRGARFGTVVKVGRKFVHVNMDATGRTVKFHPSSLTVIGG